jgi:hypothetical protein
MGDLHLPDIALVISVLNGTAALALAVVRLRDRWGRRK